MLQPNWRRDHFRVRMEMDVQGNVNVTGDPLAPSPANSSSAKQQLPIEAQAQLDFEERFLRPADAEPSSPVVATQRHYAEAVGISTLNKTKRTVTLRDDAIQVISRREILPETIYSDDTFLTQDELDLLQTPIASVALDHLMPAEPMRRGDEVTIDSTTVASVFNLTGVPASDVTMTLVDFDASVAKLQLRGTVDGSVRGVPTRQRLVGKLTFDRRAATVTWAAVAIHETREVGKTEPGFDITAKIQLIRKPLDACKSLPKSPAEIDFDQPAPESRLFKAIGSDRVQAAALLDRRWHLLQDQPGEAILRMVDTDATIAQCNLRPLAKLKPGEQLTLEAFQKDCRRTLDRQASEVIQAEESLSETGLRVLKMTATGQVQGIPIQWIMMHFSDDTGRRLLATITMDNASVPKLDGSDVQLAATMTFTKPGQSDVDKPQEKVTEVASRQLKSSFDTAGTSHRGSGQTSDVRSASDLGSRKR
ncbi:MAG: hypothetical protein AAF539_05875 [Planctomycetota bacterium]